MVANFGQIISLSIASSATSASAAARHTLILPPALPSAFTASVAFDTPFTLTLLRAARDVAITLVTSSQITFTLVVTMVVVVMMMMRAIALTLALFHFACFAFYLSTAAEVAFAPRRSRAHFCTHVSEAVVTVTLEERFEVFV